MILFHVPKYSNFLPSVILRVTAQEFKLKDSNRGQSGIEDYLDWKDGSNFTRLLGHSIFVELEPTIGFTIKRLSSDYVNLLVV